MERVDSNGPDERSRTDVPVRLINGSPEIATGWTSRRDRLDANFIVDNERTVEPLAIRRTTIISVLPQLTGT